MDEGPHRSYLLGAHRCGQRLRLQAFGEPHATVGDVGGKQAFAVVSQLRNIDSRRLYQKIAWLPGDMLVAIRNETFRINSSVRPKNNS